MDFDAVRDFNRLAHDEQVDEDEQGKDQKRWQGGKRAHKKDQPAPRPGRDGPGEDAQDRQKQAAILILIKDEDTALRRQHADIAVERAAPTGDRVHLIVRCRGRRLPAGEFIRQPWIEIHAGRYKAQVLAHARNLLPRTSRGSGEGSNSRRFQRSYRHSWFQYIVNNYSNL